MGYDHGALSPRSLSVSTTSPAYAASLPARVLSPHLQKSLAALQSGPPDLRVAVPHPHDAAGQWGAPHHMSAQASYQGGQAAHSQQQQHHHQQQQQHHQQQRAASWDMSSYLESSSTATAGGSSASQAAQPMHGQYGAPGRRMSAQQVSQPMPRS